MLVRRPGMPEVIPPGVDLVVTSRYTPHAKIYLMEFDGVAEYMSWRKDLSDSIIAIGGVPDAVATEPASGEGDDGHTPRSEAAESAS